MKYVTIITTLFFVSNAFAAEIDFSRHITDLDGKDIPSSAAKDAKPIDLASISGMALLTEPPAERGQAQSPADKLARFNLALKIHAGGKIDLSSEETTLLKNAIGTVYPPLVVGRAIEILDPKPTKKDNFVKN